MKLHCFHSLEENRKIEEIDKEFNPPKTRNVPTYNDKYSITKRLASKLDNETSCFQSKTSHQATQFRLREKPCLQILVELSITHSVPAGAGTKKHN